MIKRNVRRWTVGVLFGLLLTAGAIGLCVYAARGMVKSEREARGASEELVATAPMRILLMGRDRTSGLCDVMMLLQVDDTEVTVLQIPRDTYASYTESAYRKLNGALQSLGDARAVADFLATSFGVEISHYAVVDLDVLNRAVDLLGGVEITLPEALDYEDLAQGLSIHLPAGTQRLDGKAAEYFVRYRMGYVRGDLGRMDAQKLFLAALFRTVQAESDLLTLTRLITTVLPRVETDLSWSEGLHLARRMMNMEESGLVMMTLPGADAVASKSGASYYVLSAPATEEILQRYFGAAGVFDGERIFENNAYTHFCEIYAQYVPYAVYSAAELIQNGIEIEKTP